MTRRRRALGVALLAVAVVVAAAIVLFTRRDQSGDLAAALERVVDTGAPGALVVVRMGDDVESVTGGTAGGRRR